MPLTGISQDHVLVSEQIDQLPGHLREHLRFETLLADLSARFVGLPADSIDQAIESAQEAICRCLEVDHSTIWQADSCGQDLLLTHVYRHPSLPPRPDRMSAAESFPWTFKKALSREIVSVPRTVEAGPDAAVDRQSWLAYSIKSALIIPLAVGDGPVFGVLSFEATREERDWPELLLQRLKLLAQVFANAIGRRRTESALRESEARLNLAAACAAAGLWTLNPATGEIWSTETARKIFGVAENEPFNWDELQALVHPDDRRAVAQSLETALQSGKEASVEYRIIRGDGTIRWMTSLGRVNVDHLSGSSLVMGVSIDITERKAVELELANSCAQIQALNERAEAENEYLQAEIKHAGSFDDIVGRSEALKKVLQRVEQVAPTNSIVLITGETGTGKELLARAIHALSKRSARAMIKVDCAALPPTLIESELFGREKGAYTGAHTRQLGRFETADGSTLFIDEIGELALDLQSKLLRVVQDGEFERLGSAKTTRIDVRLVVATHRDLAGHVKNGTFREDLFYRLNVFPICMPPLRDRPEDIPLLVDAFLREFEKKIDKKIGTVPASVIEALQNYSWPGNIRELRNVIEHAVIVSSGGRLDVQLPTSAPMRDTRTLKDMQYQHVLSVLEKTNGRIKGPRGAAAILGMKPSTLYSLIHRLQIPLRQQDAE